MSELTDSSWRHGDSPTGSSPSRAPASSSGLVAPVPSAVSCITMNQRRVLARVQREPLSLDALSEWCGRPNCGAVASFLGITRNNFGGQRVLRLEYEGYEPMAVVVMRQIAAEVFAEWPDVARVAMVHRVGSVPVGQSSIAIVCSAPHRKEALEAVHFAIDRVKALVPIWKKEVYGGTYVEENEDERELFKEAEREEAGKIGLECGCGDDDGAGASKLVAQILGDHSQEDSKVKNATDFDDAVPGPQWKVNKEWNALRAVDFSRKHSST